eukprot:gene11228-11377_t
MDDTLEPSNLYAEGCTPDVVLALRDCKGNTLLRLKAVKAILASWSPVLRGALELAPNMDSSCGHGSGAVNSCQLGISSSGGISAGGSSAGCGTACGSAGISFLSCNGAGGGTAALSDFGAGGSCTIMTGGTLSTVTAGACGSCSCALQELPLQAGVKSGIDSHKELEAWRVAMCLMHPLDPQCGKTPSSLITTCAIKPLVMLADKYNLQGLLPHCKDMLLDPRSTFGVPGIHDHYKLDALEWIQIAEGVPGFEAVVGRCITQIVASTTTSRGRSQRLSGQLDQPRYRSHEALLSAMSCLRPETCAKLATSMASCLAVACENMANQDRYSIKPVGDHWWGWEYQYEPFRK